MSIAISLGVHWAASCKNDAEITWWNMIQICLVFWGAKGVPTPVNLLTQHPLILPCVCIRTDVQTRSPRLLKYKRMWISGDVFSLRKSRVCDPKQWTGTLRPRQRGVIRRVSRLCVLCMYVCIRVHMYVCMWVECVICIFKLNLILYMVFGRDLQLFEVVEIVWDLFVEKEIWQ